MPSPTSRSTSSRSSTVRSATSAKTCPFLVTAAITVLPDGSASIAVERTRHVLSGCRARRGRHTGSSIRHDVEREARGDDQRDQSVAAGRRHGEEVPARLAVAGRSCRPRRDGAAHPGRHGLRGSGRASAGDGPLCHDRAPDRVCGVRSVPDPRAGPGFLAGTHHRRVDPSARPRRQRARGRAGRVCWRSWSACCCWSAGFCGSGS